MWRRPAGRKRELNKDWEGWVFFFVGRMDPTMAGRQGEGREQQREAGFHEHILDMCQIKDAGRKLTVNACVRVHIRTESRRGGTAAFSLTSKESAHGKPKRPHQREDERTRGFAVCVCFSWLTQQRTYERRRRHN